MNRCIYILCFMLLTIIACQKDEVIISEDPDIMVPEVIFEVFDLTISTVDPSSLVTFVLLSDESGEALFDTTGTNLNFDIDLDLVSGTVVDATVGFLNEEKFEINSYLAVNSGSVIDVSENWKTHPCFKSRSVKHIAEAKLYITGLNNVHETINSMSNWGAPELTGDTLIIEGFAFRGGDNQIAIRETENSDLMSLIIPREDWTWFNETQSMEHTVSFNDFSATKEYLIDLGRENLWGVEAIVCQENGSLIALQNSTHSSSEYQEGDHIKVLLNEEVEMNELKLHFYGSNFPRGFSYNWIHESIPEKIDLGLDVDPRYRSFEKDHFWIDTTYDYNVNITEYAYTLNQTGSVWRVISKGGGDFGFKLPKLPSELYTEFPFLEGLLQNPYGLNNYMIKTENPLDNITAVSTAMIRLNNTPDANFFRKTTYLEF